MFAIERKRKRVVLTLEEKLGVIQDRDLGNSIECIAEKYNIGGNFVDHFKNKIEYL